MLSRLLLCALVCWSWRPAAAADQPVNSISAARIEAYVRALAAFGTRQTLSETASKTHGIGAARRYIFDQLQKCSRASGGRLLVARDEFVADVGQRVPTPTPIVNIVATLPGTQAPSRDRVYVVSGHYDSRASDVMDSHNDAPGADDDASGTAAMIEMACTMSHYRFDATLVFMAVAGEEQGLIGSTHWAQQAAAKHMQIAGMITNDIIGSSHGADGRSYAGRVRLFAEGVPPEESLPVKVRTRIATGGENDSAARELARFIVEQGERAVPRMHIELIYRRDRYLRGGDHIPFLQEGFPAVRFTEASEDYRHQHQNVRMENGIQYGDLVKFVDFNYLAAVTRINTAALTALARGPAAPRDALIETIELENDTTLRWAANTEPDLAGYRIVWRTTTAPFWQHHVDVSNVTRYTLKNVSKDDYIFGVVALDKDGNPSFASYPAPFRSKR